MQPLAWLAVALVLALAVLGRRMSAGPLAWLAVALSPRVASLRDVVRT